MERIAEEIGAIRNTATQQQIGDKVKEMAVIFHEAAKAVFGVKVIPGEGRLKAHSQKVTRAADKKDRWVDKVNRLKKAGAPYAVQKQAEDKRRKARTAFKKALWEDGQVVGSKTMENLKKEKSKGGRAKLMAMVTNRFTKAACKRRGADGMRHAVFEYGGERMERYGEEVGQVSSRYTFKVSEYNPEAEEFCKHFLQVGKAGAELATGKLLQVGADREDNDPPTAKELDAALKDAGSKVYKATGTDRVTNWMLAWGGATTRVALLGVYHACWVSDEVPEDWDEAMIRYLHKAGPREQVNNYRPISLIQIMGKVYTRCFMPRLVNKIGKEMDVAQGCGAKGQGSSEHLWGLVSLLEDALEAQQQDEEDQGVYAYFADMTKAYDLVWRDGLYLALYLQG